MKRTPIPRGTSTLSRSPMKRTTKPMNQRSKKRRAYLASDAHKAAYGAAEGYCVGHANGAPGRCWGDLTPHHTMKRSAAGLEVAERDAPVVTLCAWLNGAIESDPAVRRWAIRTTFVRAGVAYPFLVVRKVAA